MNTLGRMAPHDGQDSLDYKVWRGCYPTVLSTSKYF